LEERTAFDCQRTTAEIPDAPAIVVSNVVGKSAVHDGRGAIIVVKARSLGGAGVVRDGAVGKRQGAHLVVDGPAVAGIGARESQIIQSQIGARVHFKDPMMVSAGDRYRLPSAVNGQRVHDIRQHRCQRDRAAHVEVDGVVAIAARTSVNPDIICGVRGDDRVVKGAESHVAGIVQRSHGDRVCMADGRVSKRHQQGHCGN
jgi:hypothetical protein